MSGNDENARLSEAGAEAEVEAKAKAEGEPGAEPQPEPAPQPEPRAEVFGLTRERVEAYIARQLAGQPSASREARAERQAHINKKIEAAAGDRGARRFFVVYQPEDGPDGLPDDNLDRVVAAGPVVFTAESQNENLSCFYESEILIDPTWLQAAACANQAILATGDLERRHLAGVAPDGPKPEGDEPWPHRLLLHAGRPPAQTPAPPDDPAEAPGSPSGGPEAPTGGTPAPAPEVKPETT